MKKLNMAIMEQVTHVPKDRVESIQEELTGWGVQLMDCVPFQRGVIDGCLMALAMHGPSRPCIEAIIVHSIQIGMAYAKAEREIAELEAIT